jgi:hypothetical protein
MVCSFIYSYFSEFSYGYLPAEVPPETGNLLSNRNYDQMKLGRVTLTVLRIRTLNRSKVGDGSWGLWLKIRIRDKHRRSATLVLDIIYCIFFIFTIKTEQKESLTKKKRNFTLLLVKNRQQNLFLRIRILHNLLLS